MDVVRRGSGSSELVLLDGVERSGDTVKVIRNSVISQGGTQASAPVAPMLDSAEMYASTSTPGLNKSVSASRQTPPLLKRVTLPSCYEKTWSFL